MTNFTEESIFNILDTELKRISAHKRSGDSTMPTLIYDLVARLAAMSFGKALLGQAASDRLWKSYIDHESSQTQTLAELGRPVSVTVHTTPDGTKYHTIEYTNND